jgi:hypothetical protein
MVLMRTLSTRQARLCVSRPDSYIQQFAHVLATTAAIALTCASPRLTAEPGKNPSTATAAAAPATPIGMEMIANTSHSITLAWRSPKNDATAYNVYISRTADGPFAHFAQVTERTVTHANLAPGSTHFYTVSALRDGLESRPSSPSPGMTIESWQHRPFPARIARNMCLTLGSPVVSNAKPISGELSNLTDGSDATHCRLRKSAELKVRLNPEIAISDAPYLILHFRADGGAVVWSNDKQARTFKQYTVIESPDSTNGEDGTWREVTSGINEHLDGVIVIRNTKPKWIGIRSSYSPNSEIPKKTDRRPMPNDLVLARLDVFRSAPAGQRNDYWIFVGDSLMVQDLPASADSARTALFPDLVRKQHPDRYPIVVHAGMGGERIADTLSRTRRILASLSPDNGTNTATATILCWETGYNDVGVGGTVSLGGGLIPSYETINRLCTEKGLILVPARIQFSIHYLNRETLEPAKDNIFVNTRGVNLGGVDVFARASTPYACDPKTQLPYADYWTYTRENFATALLKDGVHHTKEGSDGINHLWANVADKMIYSVQK